MSCAYFETEYEWYHVPYIFPCEIFLYCSIQGYTLPLLRLLDGFHMHISSFLTPKLLNQKIHLYFACCFRQLFSIGMYYAILAFLSGQSPTFLWSPDYFKQIQLDPWFSIYFLCNVLCIAVPIYSYHPWCF